MEHHLSSTPGNVHWGLWDATLPPVLKIASGDRVTIETLSGEPEDMPDPASGFRVLRTVILPLALPGVLAGATFAFVLSLGDFLAPLLLGGPSGIMISNVVVSLFGAAYDWPLGAAISLSMLMLVVLLLMATERLEKRWSFR